MTMKLACLRCKRKKVKCDRGDPVCHQCITAKTECQYVERRQRPRNAQQRVAVHHLSQRLEELEKQLSNAGSTRSPARSRSIQISEPDTSSEKDDSVDSIPSPEVSLMTGDGQESWVYRMASDARRNFQSHATPVSTPTLRIDDAMLSLNDALDDLGKLRIRTDACRADLNLTVAEARECVEAFITVLLNMVVPDVFASSIDLELLRLLPDIINSRYVNIEPAMYVMYYNALYYGLNDLRGPGDPVAQGMYLKVLEAVPAWLDSPQETDMDGHTAALTAWTATNNHDYQLSWKFHLKSCHYVKTKKIDHIDVTPGRTFQEEEKKENGRYLFWHILSTDQLFRLFYGKPTVLRWVPNRVRPPAVMRSDHMHPNMIQTMLSVAWTRYTHMTAVIMNEIDATPSPEQNAELHKKVDEYCMRLQELMREWKMEDLMGENVEDGLRFLVADHVMTIYSFMIGIKRLVRQSGHDIPVDNITISAARKVVQFTIDFTMDWGTAKHARSVCIQYAFISFYPFCAAFSLYENILLCANPDDCEQDILLLEGIGTAMSQASASQSALTPFARTINALNKVSRTFHEDRRRARDADASVGQTAYNMPELDMSAFASLPDLPFNFEDNTQPLGFFRALENDLTTRNWQEGWWDIGAGLDPMMDIPQTGVPH